MLKRWISFLLCLNMLVALLPVQSFAVEDATEPIEEIVETEPTEEVTVPTETIVEETAPEAITEPQLVCTGLVDCPGNDHTRMHRDS